MKRDVLDEIVPIENSLCDRLHRLSVIGGFDHPLAKRDQKVALSLEQRYNCLLADEDRTVCIEETGWPQSNCSIEAGDPLRPIGIDELAVEIGRYIQIATEKPAFIRFVETNMSRTVS